jgi:molybdate transport system ATP-binding protein
MADLINIAVRHKLGALALDVQFTSAAGVTALFGRSGAGKTTLMNVIAGIVRPEHGRIELNGEVLLDTTLGICVPAHRRHVGYVFQDARLFPHMSVRSNLMYGARLRPSAERHIKLDTIVGLLDLGELLERRPGDLSGGEKQRVAIGRALLANPRVLLLDEPLAGLDAHRKNEVLHYIEVMREQVSVPMIYVSHSVSEVVRIAEWVVLLSEGKVAAAGEVEDIMGRPDLGAAVGIFEGGTVLDARVIAQDANDELATLSFDGGTLAVTNADAMVGEAVRVRIRARDVSIALERPRDISIQNILEGEVTELGRARAGIVDVTLLVGGVSLRSRITRRAAEQLALVPGLRVFALVKAISLDREAVGHA